MKNPSLTFRRIRGRIVPVHVSKTGHSTGKITKESLKGYVKTQDTLKYKAIAAAESVAARVAKLGKGKSGIAAAGAVLGVGAYGLNKYMKRKKQAK